MRALSFVRDPVLDAWYLVAFVATCAIGLAASRTLTDTHGAAGKIGVAAAWVVGVLVWAAFVLWFTGRLKARRADAG